MDNAERFVITYPPDSNLSVIRPLYNWAQGNNDAKQGNLSRKLATVESFKVDEGLTLEKSALKLFTVANLPYQLSR